MCNPGSGQKSIYASMYCDVSKLSQKSTLFDEGEEEIYKIVAEQLGYDFKSGNTPIIKAILDGNCKSVNEVMGKHAIAYEDLPQNIKMACAGEVGSEEEKAIAPPSVTSTVEIEYWNAEMTKVRTLYENERIMAQTKLRLKGGFDASEKFWDGKLTDSMPFDLMVDLNLIEKILFGSQAKWNSNVFSFPDKNKDKESEGAGDLPEGASTSSSPTETTPPETETGSNEVNISKTEGENQACYPPENPDADLGDHPGSSGGTADEKDKTCGNGKIEIENAEQCDDGNKLTGDGCNQFCMKENGSGTEVCMDPEAVTFKDDEGGNSSSNSSSTSTGTGTRTNNDCPAGTFPAKTDITGPETDELPTSVPQDPNYPGPFVGGVYKNFGASKKPPCGPGQSEVKIKIAGQSLEESRCLPTELCGNFEDARKFLFGDGYLDDEGKKKAAEMIDALFCVNLKKENRPLTPYSTNEGCIDCHVSAMVDTLEEALSGQIAPLENTTSSFGISSRWGPKFSLNLTTSIKASIRTLLKDPEESLVNAKSYLNKSIIENTKPEPALTSNETDAEKVIRLTEELAVKTENLNADIRNYQLASTSIDDQSLAGRITPLISTINGIFEALQSKYLGIADTAQQLSKIKSCAK